MSALSPILEREMPRVMIPAIETQAPPASSRSWLYRALFIAAMVGLGVLLVGIAMMSALAIGACG